jgi:hypothetical protein
MLLHVAMDVANGVLPWFIIDLLDQSTPANSY